MKKGKESVVRQEKDKIRGARANCLAPASPPRARRPTALPTVLAQAARLLSPPRRRRRRALVGVARAVPKRWRRWPLLLPWLGLGLLGGGATRRVARRVWPDGGEVQAALLGAGGGVEQARPAAPIGPDLGPLGSIWVGAGRPSLRSAAVRGAGEELVMGMASTAPRLLQRGGGSFMGPTGQCGPVCSCCCVRSATASGGGGCALPRGCGGVVPIYCLSS